MPVLYSCTFFALESVPPAFSSKKMERVCPACVAPSLCPNKKEQKSRGGQGHVSISVERRVALYFRVGDTTGGAFITFPHTLLWRQHNSRVGTLQQIRWRSWRSLFFSRRALCSRPTLCNKKQIPLSCLLCPSDSSVSYGRVWTQTSTNPPYFMPNVIFLWIRAVMMLVICMPPPCFALANHMRPYTLSMPPRIPYRAAAASKLGQRLVVLWEDIDRREKHWRRA